MGRHPKPVTTPAVSTCNKILDNGIGK